MELMSIHGLRAKTPKTRAGEFGNRFHWNKSDSVIEIYVPIETGVKKGRSTDLPNQRMNQTPISPGAGYARCQLRIFDCYKSEHWTSPKFS